MPPVEMKITVSQTRDYGNFHHNIAVEMNVTVENSAGRQVAYDNLNKLISQEFASFESNYLPNVQSAKTDNNEVTWAGGEVVRLQQGEKVMYRLKTGRWSEWGIPIYEEVLPQFPDDMIGKASYPMDDYGGTLYIDGKDKKVLTCRLIPR